MEKVEIERRVERCERTAKLDFGVSEAIPAYCIREIVTNRSPCVTKGAGCWPTAFRRFGAMRSRLVCIWKLIGTESERRRTYFRVLPASQRKLALAVMLRSPDRRDESRLLAGVRSGMRLER